ncbi:MarR family winged helix-turn-helix transcriptional regulator [Marivita sp. S0852]|uniref:MarR family winged helix-turn-helix transcriptional regulator n=1 Tax=Marivita sp. S0852 TaxID=3373893 RepID=UPI003982B704
MSFVKDQSAGYLANHMARVFARGLTARIKPLGLTTGTFPALLELWETDGLTQKQLVERLDIEQATMANTLARMERDGLIVRKKDTNDGRVQRVWLTDRGRGLRRPAIEAAMAENAEALASLSEDEQRHLIRLMQKVIAARKNRSDSASAQPNYK